MNVPVASLHQRWFKIWWRDAYGKNGPMARRWLSNICDQIIVLGRLEVGVCLSGRDDRALGCHGTTLPLLRHMAVSRKYHYHGGDVLDCFSYSEYAESRCPSHPSQAR